MTRFNHGYSVIRLPGSQPSMHWDSVLEDRPDMDRQQVADYHTYMDMYAEEEQKQRRPRYLHELDPELLDTVFYAPDEKVDVQEMWRQLEREEKLEQESIELPNSLSLRAAGSSASQVDDSGRESLAYLLEDIDESVGTDEEEDFLLCDLSNAADMVSCHPRHERIDEQYTQGLAHGKILPSSDSDVMMVENMLTSDEACDQTMVDDVGLSSSGSSGSSTAHSASPFLPLSSSKDHLFARTQFIDVQDPHADLPSLDAGPPFSATATQFSSLLTPEDTMFPSFVHTEDDTISECNTPSFGSISFSEESSFVPHNISFASEDSPASSTRFPSSMSSKQNHIGLSFHKVPILSSPEKAQLFTRRMLRTSSSPRQEATS
ncbi:hypothetical protein CALVIDRAFT_529982 [Calocera viscosa TUFC12733]|uniref:Uncharacterized protein n=1 Tax=Calocera viscosa (strain TUFC12733) TaxID=1330018 RepID=A0A167II72_CALVF|nr:hypothetical protein CALVIDRAFT_529982 [Calocera viscosa TUFC12733]